MYFGELDKNKKEIKLGDIVRMHSRGFTFTVYIDNTGDYVVLDNLDLEHMSYSPDWDSSEIIGNVFDIVKEIS